ncbi:MAG: hypothetical protein MZV64_09895 [Ignavibacteriales bacterium]|nr:hypothetical protein [Ignavibacteriales bacterium]
MRTGLPDPRGRGRSDRDLRGGRVRPGRHVRPACSSRPGNGPRSSPYRLFSGRLPPGRAGGRQRSRGMRSPMSRMKPQAAAASRCSGRQRRPDRPLPGEHRISWPSTGMPSSKRMGILGEYPKEQLAGLLSRLCPALRRGQRRPGRRSGRCSTSSTAPAGPRARSATCPDTVVQRVRPLRRGAGHAGLPGPPDRQVHGGGVAMRQAPAPSCGIPNVHLALDPEWRTLSPMKEIGSVTAAELNRGPGARCRPT